MYGRENVPPTGPVLLVCNHQSNLDPMLIGVALNRTLSYIAKSELFQNAHADRLLRWLGAFPVRQGSVDASALKEAISRLRQGRALAIFPEGSRTPDGQMLPIQRGVGLIVRRTSTPVLPVVLDGSFDAWSIHMNWFRPAKVRLLYGKPHDLTGLDENEVLEWIGHTLHQRLADLKRMA